MALITTGCVGSAGHETSRYSLGIEAGLARGATADATIVFDDLGIAPGMRQGTARARQENRLEFLSLTSDRAHPR